MKRDFIPVRLDRDGVPLVGCTGSCAQGHQACNCELADYVQPADTGHELGAPPAFTRAQALVIAVAALALLAFGIWIFPH